MGFAVAKTLRNPGKYSRAAKSGRKKERPTSSFPVGSLIKGTADLISFPFASTIKRPERPYLFLLGLVMTLDDFCLFLPLFFSFSHFHLSKVLNLYSFMDIFRDSFWRGLASMDSWFESKLYSCACVFRSMIFCSEKKINMLIIKEGYNLD